MSVVLLNCKNIENIDNYSLFELHIYLSLFRCSESEETTNGKPDRPVLPEASMLTSAQGNVATYGPEYYRLNVGKIFK
jgi:hypothetical protein